MLTHGGDDLYDYRFSLGQPLFALALTLSGLPALLIIIIGLGEGRTYFIHQLTKALVAHRYIGRPVIGLKDFSVAKTLVCKWHLRCCMKFPGVRCFIIVRPWRSAPSSAIGNPLTPRGTAAASPQAPSFEVISVPEVALQDFLRDQHRSHLQGTVPDVPDLMLWISFILVGDGHAIEATPSPPVVASLRPMNR